MPNASSHCYPADRSSDGFALVIALSLMSFVLLLLLSITTLVRVETQSALISSTQIEAEQNALLGLGVALGELQKAVGPDRRVSARSEILSETPSYPRVLGIYNIDPSEISPSMSSIDQYFEDLRSGSRSRVKWLVSVEDPELRPLTDPNVQLPEALSGSTVAIQSYLAPDGSEAQVSAGEVLLETPSNGSFAWWVDEENLKAKFNVTAPRETDLGVPFEDEWSLGTSQFVNFFKIDTSPASGSYQPSSIDNYDPVTDRPDLLKLMSSQQVDQRFVVSDLPDWYKAGVFDYTVHSFGLPVDVTHGRLKEDLSAYLNDGAGLNDSDSIIRGSLADSNFEGPPLSDIRYGDNDMPRFGLLKSWKEIGSTVTGFDRGGVTSRPHTNLEHGIHPVIARAGYSYSNIFEDMGVFRNRTRNLDLKVVIFPRITLWNPTSVPITDTHYVFQIGLLDNMYLYAGPSQNQGQAAVVDNYGNQYEAGAWGGGLNITQWNFRVQFPDDHSLMIGNQSFAPSFTFTLELNSPLLPGQTRTFYPDATAVELQRYDDTAFNNITTTNASSGNVLVNRPNANNYYIVPGGSGTSTVSYTSTSGAPPVPTYLEAYTRLQPAFVGNDPSFWAGGGQIVGAYYRLFGVSDSDEPSLLQEFVSIEDSGTDEYPPYSSVNASYYDDPADGVLAEGFTLQRFSTVPDFSLGRGHQIFLSYAKEDPRSDYGSIFADESRQFSMYSHYNTRSRHVFPGTFEESNSATQSLSSTDFNLTHQGIRQSIYSEGRPEKAWLNDWISDLESGYGSGSDFGSPLLYDLNDSSNGLVYPLYDFPRAADGVLSLGSFQSVNFASYPWQPGHSFGNSRATPRIERANIVSTDYDTARDHPYVQQLLLGDNRYIDLSWLLNFSMWDRFIVSTLDYGGSFASTKDTVLKNSRHVITDYGRGQTGDLIPRDSALAFAGAAANILVNGAFNVNSTSVSAWKQFLSSQMNLQVSVANIQGGADSTPVDQAVFPRLLYPYRAEQPVGDRGVDGNFNSTKSAFAANRSLTDLELQALAERIVEEVRLRGPFISLADFVNRRLVDENDTTYGVWAGLSGVLQTAIDAVTRDQSLINDHLFDDPDLVFDRSAVPSYLKQAHVVGLPDGADSQSRLMDAPGALTQADILSSHGALMTVRGDTFRIRSYGKSAEGIAGGEHAEAWCEAIVQRTTIPVAKGDDIVHPDESTFPFGRQFQVVSFRWLTKDEI